MSASRTRTLGAVIAATAAMVALTACGGGSDKNNKRSDDSPKKPAASAGKDDDNKSSAAPSAPTFGEGLVVARCYVQDGALKLELNDYKVGTSDTLGQKIIDWQATNGDLNTSSPGGCDGRHMKAGYNADYSKMFASRYDGTEQVFSVGAIDMDSGGFSQLTKSSSDAFSKVSTVAPSVHGDRVYYWDVSNDETSVLKSMKSDGTGVKDESALQKKFDELGPNVNNDRQTDPYMVPGVGKPVIASDASDETAYTADGSTWARMEASGPVSVTKGGKTTEYNWDVPGNPPMTVAGQHRMGGFLSDGSLIFSDGAQIYRGKPAGDKLDVTVVLKNTSERRIDDLAISKDGTSIAFVYVNKPGMGIVTESTQLYTLPVSGGEPKLLTEFPNPNGDLQGTVRIVDYAGTK